MAQHRPYLTWSLHNCQAEDLHVPIGGSVTGFPQKLSINFFCISSVEARAQPAVLEASFAAFSISGLGVYIS